MCTNASAISDSGKVESVNKHVIMLSGGYLENAAGRGGGGRPVSRDADATKPQLISHVSNRDTARPLCAPLA